MKAYKVKMSEADYKELSGRIFYMIDNQLILLATPMKRHEFLSNSTLDRLKRVDLIEEVNLLDEKRIHPHLFKPIKKQVEENLSVV